MNHNRRDFLKGAAAMGAFATFGPALIHAASSSRKPNIVFILADDLGWSDLGCYGSKINKTPHLDTLAKQGMRFTQAYAAAPVCGPTRASLMTGVFPARIGALNWGGCTVPPERTTLAEALQKGGYQTGFFGKWHLGGTATTLPEAHGFDSNVAGCGWGQPKSYFSPYKHPTLKDGPEGEYLTDRLTDDAIKFIETNQKKPFVLYMSHYGVHWPFQAKAEDIR